MFYLTHGHHEDLKSDSSCKFPLGTQPNIPSGPGLDQDHDLGEEWASASSHHFPMNMGGFTCTNVHVCIRKNFKLVSIRVSSLKFTNRTLIFVILSCLICKCFWHFTSHSSKSTSSHSFMFKKTHIHQSTSTVL